MSTTKTPKTTEIPFFGKAEATQLDAWQKQHGKIHEINVEVLDEEGRVKEIAVCYVKKPSREHYALGIQYLNQDKILQMGEVITRNCWVGGDDRLKPDTGDTVMAVTAALEAKKLFTFHNSYLKNL